MLECRLIQLSANSSCFTESTEYNTENQMKKYEKI